MMITAKMTNRLQTRRGSAYVEYFVAAGAFALAAMWFYDNGNYKHVMDPQVATMNSQMNEMKGP